MPRRFGSSTLALHLSLVGLVFRLDAMGDNEEGALFDDLGEKDFYTKQEVIALLAKVVIRVQQENNTRRANELDAHRSELNMLYAMVNNKLGASDSGAKTRSADTLNESDANKSGASGANTSDASGAETCEHNPYERRTPVHPGCYVRTIKGSVHTAMVNENLISEPSKRKLHEVEECD